MASAGHVVTGEPRAGRKHHTAQRVRRGAARQLREEKAFPIRAHRALSEAGPPRERGPLGAGRSASATAQRPRASPPASSCLPDPQASRGLGTHAHGSPLEPGPRARPSPPRSQHAVPPSFRGARGRGGGLAAPQPVTLPPPPPPPPATRAERPFKPVGPRASGGLLPVTQAPGESRATSSKRGVPAPSHRSPSPRQSRGSSPTGSRSFRVCLAPPTGRTAPLNP